MADKKLTDLNENTAPATGDLLLSVDISDTTMGGTGTDKKLLMSTLLDMLYPIGTVYTNATDSTNPGTLLGFGTWTAIEGECVVGYKSGDTNFGTAGTSVGEATHVLTQTEMPAHTHTVYAQHDYVSSGTDRSAVTGSSSTDNKTSGSTGGGGAHNNIQPSLVCYVWQRTA